MSGLWRDTMPKCEMCDQEVEHKEYYACTGWTIRDIQNTAALQDEEITDEEALAFLEEHGHSLADAMVAAGWDYIRYEIDSFLQSKREPELKAKGGE